MDVNHHSVVLSKEAGISSKTKNPATVFLSMLLVFGIVATYTLPAEILSTDTASSSRHEFGEIYEENVSSPS